MATLVNGQNNAAPNQAQGSSDAGAGNALMKISAGPAALAQLLIYEIMALYGQILAMDQKQKINMVQAQSAEAHGAAQAQIASGNDQLIMYSVMGALSIASAAASLGVQTYMQRNEAGQEIAKEESDTLNKLTPMKGLKAALTVAPDEAEMNGPFQPGRGSNALRDQFENGNFENASDAQETKDAVRILKQEKSAAEFNEWESRVNKDFDQASMNYNSAVQRANSRQQVIGTYTQMTTQGVTAVSNGVQGGLTAQKAKHDADNSLQQTSTQMAGSAASDLGQAANKAFESQNAEIQVLENINRTNSVNG
ncbi:MAG: hypothetical protein JSS30_06355 [Verrucomicrobia bacterium]|nr:hypothetical protein [Verrucomicrobiota bacterium]